MVFQTKHLKIGGAVILVTVALVIGLSVGLTQNKNGEADTFRRATSRQSIKPTSRRPTRPTRKPTTKTPTRRPTTKIPTSTQKYTVLEKVKHDQTSFTQGLSYGDDGFIYETTGLYGQSKVRKINSTTFDVKLSVNMNSQYFGEGSAFYKDASGNAQLIVITWQSQTGFIYDDKLQKIKDFTYTTTAPGNEGWGITYDASKKEFIVSDGSKYLYFWDRDTLAVKRNVTVTRLNGIEQKNLNELEYIGGLVCCNIWYSDTIICVDPLTGKSVREYDMSSLCPTCKSAGVLNGIALGSNHVLLTGKNWPSMFKVKFNDWTGLF